MITTYLDDGYVKLTAIGGGRVRDKRTGRLYSEVVTTQANARHFEQPLNAELKAAVLESLGTRPLKADLLEAAAKLGITVPEGSTNPQIMALLENAVAS